MPSACKNLRFQRDMSQDIENNDKNDGEAPRSSHPGLFPPSKSSREAFLQRIACLVGKEARDSVGQKIGVSANTVRSYLNGKTEPSWSTLMQISAAYGKSVVWLMTGEGDEAEQRPPPFARDQMSDRSTSVPFHRMEDDDAPCLRVEIDPSLSNMFEAPPERGLCFVLSGDTSAPTAARGDVVMIDPTMRDLREGGVFALDLEGDVVIRRVVRQMDRSVVLRADNPLHPPCHVHAADVANLAVIGRVRWTVRAM